MKWLSNWVKSFFPKPPCKHTRIKENKWLSADGTPFGSWKCLDCPWSDCGHVYADPDTWLDPE